MFNHGLATKIGFAFRALLLWGISNLHKRDCIANISLAIPSGYEMDVQMIAAGSGGRRDTERKKWRKSFTNCRSDVKLWPNNRRDFRQKLVLGTKNMRRGTKAIGQCDHSTWTAAAAESISCPVVCERWVRDHFSIANYVYLDKDKWICWVLWVV